MLNIAIFGAPGCGKGTQSDLIVRQYDLLHISTGAMLRTEVETQSELGKQAEVYLSTGQLLPDDLMVKILTYTLEKRPTEKGFIFDGFPRTIAQAKALDHLLVEKGDGLSACFLLEVDEAVLTARIIQRAAEQGRSDDTPETIRKRMEIYQTQTLPLITYYKKQGKLLKVQGDLPVTDVFDIIRENIDRFIFQTK
jgi:adenylate kinase